MKVPLLDLKAQYEPIRSEIREVISLRRLGGSVDTGTPSWIVSASVCFC
jgi:hypothetical protein